MKTPFGEIIVSEAVPKDEVWLVTPGEQIRVLRPGEEPCVIDVKPPQIHKIVNIGNIK